MQTVNNIHEVLRNKAIRQNTCCNVSERGIFYEVNGEQITEPEFYKMFPIELKYINLKGENKDRSRI